MFKKMLLIILGFSLIAGGFWALRAQDPAASQKWSRVRPEPPTATAQTTQADPRVATARPQLDGAKIVLVGLRMEPAMSADGMPRGVDHGWLHSSRASARRHRNDTGCDEHYHHSNRCD